MRLSNPDTLLFEELGQPIQVLATEDELYVLDYFDQVIKLFDSDGQLSKSFGGGKGEGPSEHSSISNFGIGSDGSVWTVDIRQKRISIFNNDTSLRSVVKIDERFLQGAVVGESLITFSATSDEIFTSFTLEGMQISNFGIPDVIRSPNGLELVGNFRNLDLNSFVYVPNGTDLIMSYSTSGDRVFSRRAVGSDQPLAPNNRIMNTLINVSDGIFYIRNARGSRGSWESYIDAYASADGTYLYSVDASELNPCFPAYIDKVDVFTVCEGVLVKWKYTIE